MANVKITELTALTDPASSDVLPIVDVGADETKKVTIADLLENAGDGAAATPAFSFDNDKSVGMWRPGSEQLALSTSGTTRLFIDSSGNIGVNTSSPGYTLHVNGRIAAADGTDSSPSLTFASGGGNGLYYAGSGNVGLSTGGSEKLRITSAGNCGVGTTSPGGKLDIRVNNSPQKDIIAGYTAGSPMFTYRNGSGAWFHAGKHPTDDGFVVTSGATTTTSEFFRITNAGNCGIGATSPSGKLDVFDGTSVDAYFGKTTDSVYLKQTSFFTSIQLGSNRPGQTGSNRIIQYNRSNGRFQYLAGTNGSETAALTIDNDGRLGIGTEFPNNLLDVRGDSTPQLKVSATNTGTNSAGLYIENQGQRNWQIWADRSTDQFRIGNNGRAATNLSITNNGKVGIGATAGDKFTVAGGNMKLQGNTYTDFSDYWGSGDNSAFFLPYGFIGSNGAFGLSMYVNGYRNNSSSFTYMGINNNTDTAAGIDLRPDGKIFLKTGTASGTDIPVRMTIASDGDCGIGTSSPSQKLHVAGSVRVQDQATSPAIYLRDTDAAGDVQFTQRNSGDFALINTATGRNVIIENNGSERLKIDSSGRLLVGISTAYAIEGFNRHHYFAPISGDSNNHIAVSAAGTGFPAIYFTRTRGSTPTTQTIIQDNDILGSLRFFGSDGTDYAHPSAEIRCNVNGTPGSNDLPGMLRFLTTSDGGTNPTERMRIMAAGHITINQFSSATPGLNNTTVGASFERLSTGSALFLSRTDNAALFLNSNSDSSVTRIHRSGTQVGSISVTTTATAYNTSSDYRLKENVVDIADGITRVKQLAPKRFNFIADADTTVDGFLAHEAQTVVPEAVTGTHNEVDDDGNAVMQGIDQSKLVPLLTAALQEAIAKIETLEQRLTDAGL